MTAVLDEIDGTEQAELATFASWGARAAALGIDVLFGVALIATLALLAWTAPLMGWLWWAYVVVAVLAGLAMMVNRWVLPTITGCNGDDGLAEIVILHAGGTPERARAGHVATMSGSA